MRRAGVAALVLCSLTLWSLAQETRPSSRPKTGLLEWTQLSLKASRVDEFLAKYPTHDGRGVVIAVLDTGVDPGVPGLDRTPTGDVKVIDLQDFSGQGDIELHTVRGGEEAGTVVDYAEEGTPITYSLPQGIAVTGDERPKLMMGMFRESAMQNSSVEDVNDDGDSDDEFAILVVVPAGGGDDEARAYVDTDMDRSFADEKLLRSYRLNYDTFAFARAKPESQITPMTMAVNIFPRERKIVVHFDDGAHGTHVAGIAAGYRINGQEGFNGIAPGAYVMGLKIGEGVISSVTVTDSVKKSLDYAARFHRESGMPVVCNMSFGVYSVIEGHSDIDKYVDRILQENPGMMFCTSAGNEGPGLSTVGTPAAANLALCIAALLAPETARDQMGVTLDDAVVTTFSSRGGELDKPDLATPGWSTSTVPAWVRDGDFWSGTSMASPYAAGLCAVLISHAKATNADWRVWARDVGLALKRASAPLPGFTAVDYGYGLPDLVKAAEELEALLPAMQDDPVLGYEVETYSPLAHRGTGRAAYWRSTWLPTGMGERQTFTIKPVFAPTADENTRIRFTRQFTLRSNADWLHVPQEQFYIKGEGAANVYVEYDGAKLREPGLYVGVVDVLHEGAVVTQLRNVLIVPHTFSAEEHFAHRHDGQRVHGWSPDRWFVAVPPGASAMHVELSAPEDAESKAVIERVFDPEGYQQRVWSNRLDTSSSKRLVSWNLDDELQPGVWELDVLSDRADTSWPYDLAVRFFGLDAEPRKIEADRTIRGTLTVTNRFEQPMVAEGSGKIEAFGVHKEAKFEGLEDELEYSVPLDERMNAVRIKLEMTPEAYATTTDISVVVTKGDGEALFNWGFDDRTFERTVRSPSPGKATTLTVKIRAGFAVSDEERKTPIDVKLDRMLSEPMSIKVSQDGRQPIRFIPGMPIEVSYQLSEKLRDIPSGTEAVGYVQFAEANTGDVALRVEIR